MAFNCRGEFVMRHEGLTLIVTGDLLDWMVPIETSDEMASMTLDKFNCFFSKAFTDDLFGYRELPQTGTMRLKIERTTIHRMTA